MSILSFFLVIFIAIKITKLETRFSLMLAMILTYLVYSDKSLVGRVNTISDKIWNRNKPENQPNIPTILMKDWYLFWKDYLRDIVEHNKENYLDIMKSLKRFQQIYLEVINGADVPHQRLENLGILQKEILNLLHSTVHSLPVTQKESLENILTQKLDFVKLELDFRMEEIRNFINNDWDNGNINYLSKPMYSNSLSTLPHNYSSNFDFY